MLQLKTGMEVFTVYGEAMRPEYKEGDQIICEEFPDPKRIWGSDNVFIVKYGGGHTAFRRASYDRERNLVILRADNINPDGQGPLYDDMELPPEKIEALYRVKYQMRRTAM